jgi:hypothetical protein
MKFDISAEPIHTRCLCVALTQGRGESIEFRADIIDLRKAGLMELGGRIATAGIIHKMELSGAFSGETGCIERIEWDQSHVMHEANRATKGECCRDPMLRLKELVGTRLGDEFASELKQCFGGALGCTHISTLFHELSAFASQLRVEMREHSELGVRRMPGERIASRSIFFDAFFPDGGATTTISVRLADIHFGEFDQGGSESLFSHDELRLVAEVELAGWQLRDVEARERSRRGPSCSDVPWQWRKEEFGEFAGRSLGGGMTRFCLERFGHRDRDARLLSALLSLAPGMTQVAVALSDGLIPSDIARPGGFAAMGPGPCYMLRAEGPLVESFSSGNPRAALKKPE